MKYNVIDVDASSLQEKYKIGLLSAKLLKASHLDDEEIHEFCSLHFNTRFAHMHKSDVNGENTIELFKYLKTQKGFEGFGNGPKALAMSVMLKSIDKDYKNNPEIKWNFTKFLVDRNGNVVERFEPTHNMKDVMSKVERLIVGE